VRTRLLSPADMSTRDPLRRRTNWAVMITRVPKVGSGKA
jgi:hypothetical protein